MTTQQLATVQAFATVLHALAGLASAAALWFLASRVRYLRGRRGERGPAGTSFGTRFYSPEPNLSPLEKEPTQRF